MLLIAILVFITAAHSITPRPVIDDKLGKPSHNASSQKHWHHHAQCTVKQFWTPDFPKPQDWVDNNIDDWLDTWFTTNLKSIKDHGFAKAWGLWALGTPDFTCHYDGSTSNCDFQASCNNQVLNGKGKDLRQAYYVTESIVRLHSYFMGLRETFESATFNAAFSKDDWTLKFNRNEDRDIEEVRDILTGAQALFGIGVAAASLAGPITAATGGALTATLAGLNGLIIPHLVEAAKDETLKKSAQLGASLGKFALSTSKSFVDMNNVLMKGDRFLDSGDIRSWLKGGWWVNFDGIDETATINAMNTLLTGQAINHLWRHQKVYIMGGGKCGDGQGIGSGPQEGAYCRESDNTAWYLYHWEDYHGILTALDTRFGLVRRPHGMDALGKGDYSTIHITDVIKSSLQAYEVAGYNYTPEFALDRAKSAMERNINPLREGPSWEGIFSIPVCNVCEAANSKLEDDPKYYQKSRILKPYTTKGHEQRPWWCGPICDGELLKTRHFIETANMHGFKSFHHKCGDHDPHIEHFITADGYSHKNGTWCQDCPEE